MRLIEIDPNAKPTAQYNFPEKPTAPKPPKAPTAGKAPVKPKIKMIKPLNPKDALINSLKQQINQTRQRLAALRERK